MASAFTRGVDRHGTEEVELLGIDLEIEIEQSTEPIGSIQQWHHFLANSLARAIYVLDRTRALIRGIKPASPDSKFLTQWKNLSIWLVLWYTLWLPVNLAWEHHFVALPLLSVSYVVDAILFIHTLLPLFSES
jgi:hypothetical protein